MEAILVINPGSTSTKIAVYDHHQVVVETIIRHTVKELADFTGLAQQKQFRYQLIDSFLKEHFKGELTAVVGRGGLLKPIPGGTYRVDEKMLEDLNNNTYGLHASNLGGILADEFAKKYHIPAFIVDPTVVDEMSDVARISGLNGIERRSVVHALNQKAIARKASLKLGKKYDQTVLIVAHLGGGISVGCHKHGRMIDIVNGLDGEGPYTPERTGGLPLVDFTKFVIDHSLSLDEVKRLVAGKGGMQSYLKETDLQIIEQMCRNHDKRAKYYLDGMCYQVAKSIGSLSVVVNGEIDAICLTGGIAHSTYVVDKISQYIAWIAPIKVFPGEMEMEALYEGTYRVLHGEEKILNYSEEGVM